MKHLFVARHGTDFCGALDSVGEREVERLADNVKNILNGGSSYIISSTAQRSL